MPNCSDLHDADGHEDRQVCQRPHSHLLLVFLRHLHVLRVGEELLVLRVADGVYVGANGVQTLSHLLQHRSPVAVAVHGAQAGHLGLVEVVVVVPVIL